MENCALRVEPTHLSQLLPPMKNLPCVIIFSTFATLVLVTVVSFLGVSFPFAGVAPNIAGFSCAAGVFALFVANCASRRSRSVAAAVRATESRRENKPAMPAAARRNSVAPWIEMRSDGSVADGGLATLGLRKDPATNSLM